MPGFNNLFKIPTLDLMCTRPYLFFSWDLLFLPCAIGKDNYQFQKEAYKSKISDQVDPDVPMSSFNLFKYTDVCGSKRVGSMIARGRVGVNITQMGQSSNSMMLEWLGILTSASTTITLSKGLYA
jgi:hypothetical protein